KDQGAEGEQGRVEPEPSPDEVEPEDTASAAEPLNIEVRPQRLALGSSFTCYLNDASELWCWGWGESFPVPGPADPLPPTKQEIGVTLTSIDAFGNRLCGLDSAGGLHCFGETFYSNLTDRNLGAQTSVVGEATSLALAADVVCTVAKQGSIQCLGSNNTAILGGVPFTRVPVAFQGPAGESFVQISAGKSHICGLTTKGGVYCWGE